MSEVRFIRKNGRIIPIKVKEPTRKERVAKGAAIAAAGAGAHLAAQQGAKALMNQGHRNVNKIRRHASIVEKSLKKARAAGEAADQAGKAFWKTGGAYSKELHHLRRAAKFSTGQAFKSAHRLYDASSALRRYGRLGGVGLGIYGVGQAFKNVFAGEKNGG